MHRSLAAFLSLFVVACASSGARSTGTYLSVDSTQKALVSARDQINRTAQSLEKLMAESGDLRDSYQSFSSNVDKMNAVARELDERAKEMRERRSDYLKAWSRESGNIKDPEIAELSAARRQQIETDLATLMEALASARADFMPYLNDLNDIRTYLKNDLTATGLQAMQPISERVLSRGSRVNESLDSALARLAAVSSTLAPRT